MSPLQKLVSSRLDELGLSTRAAADRTNGLISHTTIHRVATGESPGPWSQKTLRGLSLALDLPLSEIEKAADVPVAGTKFRVPDEWDRLTSAERAAVTSMVNALLKAHKNH